MRGDERSVGDTFGIRLGHVEINTELGIAPHPQHVMYLSIPLLNLFHHRDYWLTRTTMGRAGSYFCKVFNPYRGDPLCKKLMGSGAAVVTVTVAHLFRLCPPVP